LLTREPDIEVVADLGRGDEVLAAALRVRPAVAVLDFDLSGCDGPTIAAALHERLPECRSIMLTSCCRPASLVRALSAPVRGVILKYAPAVALADAIRKVAAGQVVRNPELTAAAASAAPSPLTARETEVLRAVQAGISTKEISAQLALSPNTVRNYLSNVILKTDARNRIDAIRIAREAGWL
jgi:two-component system, NarL family, response regulator DesR